MAVVVVRSLVCDVHQGKGETVPATRRRLNIEGKSHRADLCDECMDRLVTPALRLFEPVRGRPTKLAEVKPAKSRARRTPAKKAS